MAVEYCEDIRDGVYQRTIGVHTSWALFELPVNAWRKFTCGSLTLVLPESTTQPKTGVRSIARPGRLRGVVLTCHNNE
jgi:hypothetical protein